MCDGVFHKQHCPLIEKQDACTKRKRHWKLRRNYSDSFIGRRIKMYKLMSHKSIFLYSSNQH